MNYLQQYIVDEYIEDYQDGRVSRRELARVVTALAGGAAAATILAGVPVLADDIDAVLRPQTMTPGVTVQPDDPAIVTSGIMVPTVDGSMLNGYLSVPSAPGKYPGVQVIHENQGTAEHFRDITRRFAKEGYVAIHVDLLTRKGGAENMEPADRSAAIGQIAPEQLVSDLKDTFEYLKNLPQTIADKIGVTGYCFGGGMTWRAAVSVPDLDAAVPYYGPNPPLDQVPNTRAAVLAFYGEQDARINAGINDIEAAMKAANKTFEYKIMPGALHGFFNDTRPQTYQEAAAKDAWTMTLAWFQKYLKG